MGKPSEDWAVLDLFFGFVASHCRGRNVHCKCPTWSGLFHIAVIGCWLSLFSCWTGYVKYILFLKICIILHYLKKIKIDQYLFVMPKCHASSCQMLYCIISYHLSCYDMRLQLLIMSKCYILLCHFTSQAIAPRHVKKSWFACHVLSCHVIGL